MENIRINFLIGCWNRSRVLVLEKVSFDSKSSILCSLFLITSSKQHSIMTSRRRVLVSILGSRLFNLHKFRLQRDYCWVQFQLGLLYVRNIDYKGGRGYILATGVVVIVNNNTNDTNNNNNTAMVNINSSNSDGNNSKGSTT